MAVEPNLETLEGRVVAGYDLLRNVPSQLKYLTVGGRRLETEPEFWELAQEFEHALTGLAGCVDSLIELVNKRRQTVIDAIRKAGQL